MKLLQPQQKLLPYFKGYARFLQSYEGYTAEKAELFAKQVQDFTKSGLKPKDYFEEIDKDDKKGADTFLYNFKSFVQFQTGQYFEELHKIRWERGKGGRS